MRFGLIVMGAALAAAAFPSSAPQRISLATQRSSPQDLAISGEVPGVAQGQRGFVRYAELISLPQVSFTVKDDENFGHPVRLSGVSLDTLAAALGVTEKKFLAANSNDGYEAHYSAEYRTLHHPFLVLRIDGQEPDHWPKGPDGENYGPYLISHASFAPAYHVLAQKDEAQIPYGVVELRFLDEAAVMKQLLPPGSGAAPSSAMQGYRIVMQNCLRCHRNGDLGGTKSPFGWPQMALIAQGNPAAFGKYVVRPNSVNPEANMPANPEFDAGTIAALTAYFRSFAPAVGK
jgi:mono/diheme cytochrome c family protein